MITVTAVTILSWDRGVQSTAMALMASERVLDLK